MREIFSSGVTRTWNEIWNKQLDFNRSFRGMF